MMEKKGCMVVGGLAVIVGVIVLVAGLWFVGTSNKEVRLSNLITSKLADNKSEFDNLWKKLKETAEVPQAKMDALRQIFVEHAQGRGGVGSKAIVAWVHESVPSVADTTFDNLMNIITSSRDRWTMRQKEIADHIREYNNLFQFPSSIVMVIKGKERLDPNRYIVTSTRTETAFETRKDDDVGIFKKPANAEQPQK